MKAQINPQEGHQIQKQGKKKTTPKKQKKIIKHQKKSKN